MSQIAVICNRLIYPLEITSDKKKRLSAYCSKQHENLVTSRIINTRLECPIFHSV